MFLSTVALAQSPGGGSQGGGFMAFLPMLAILFIAYFLILRPQFKKQKEHQRMLTAIQKGDKVVTSGGIHGQVLKINEGSTTLILKVANDVKLEIDRGAITRKITPEEIKPK